MSRTREFACNFHRADKENPLAVRRSAIMSTPPNFKLTHYPTCCEYDARLASMVHGGSEKASLPANSDFRSWL